MKDLPLGLRTNLEVLVHSGSVVEDFGGHIIVRTPDNPDYHHGNSVFVTDPRRVDDVEHWLEVFTQAFPDAPYRMFALVCAPSALETNWLQHGFDLDHSEVLSTTTMPIGARAAEGYEIRPLTGAADWRLLLESKFELSREGGETVDRTQRTFLQGRVAALRGLSDRDQAVLVGAFHGGELVSSLGIVICSDGLARYQDVHTVVPYRGRGLASRLLGVAARWAGERGCSRWVMVADAGSSAARLYRACGLTEPSSMSQAYRPPQGDRHRT